MRSGKKPPLSSSDILAARTHGYERQGSLCVACQTCAAFYFRTRGEAVKVRCSPLEGDSWPLGPTNWNRAHEGPVFLSPPNSEKFRGVGCRGPSLDETSMGDEDKLRQVCLGAHSLASRIGYHPASGNRTRRGVSGKAFLVRTISAIRRRSGAGYNSGAPTCRLLDPQDFSIAGGHEPVTSGGTTVCSLEPRPT